MRNYVKYLATLGKIALSVLTFALAGILMIKHEFARWDREFDSQLASSMWSESIHAIPREYTLLVMLRSGDTTGAIRSLEGTIDRRLLMMSRQTNENARVWINGPWKQLRADRQAHPRTYTSSNEEERVSRMLDQIIDTWDESSRRSMMQAYQTVTITNGIDEAEAERLASTYYLSFISGPCPALRARDHGNKWEVLPRDDSQAAGFAPIYVSKQTAEIECSHAAAVNPRTFEDK